MLLAPPARRAVKRFARGLVSDVHVRRPAITDARVRSAGIAKTTAVRLNKELVALQGGEAVLAYFERHKTDFTAVNLATALHRLAKQTRGADSRVDGVALLAAEKIDSRCADAPTLIETFEQCLEKPVGNGLRGRRPPVRVPRAPTNRECVDPWRTRLLGRPRPERPMRRSALWCCAGNADPSTVRDDGPETARGLVLFRTLNGSAGAEDGALRACAPVLN
ncbi:hypothetical protein M885DRAFT_195744 [Pelagophyceae sp. CCMP2097]|nr:hypothetical protein M885DRAFT_195744 [Pelagophyceae sp. CCMP2097]